MGGMLTVNPPCTSLPVPPREHHLRWRVGQEIVETRQRALPVAVAVCQDGPMTDYQQPKLQGHKVALSTRVSPEQHRAAIEASRVAGLSMAEYIGALIDRDAGRPNKLDDREEPRLPLANSA